MDKILRFEKYRESSSFVFIKKRIKIEPLDSSFIILSSANILVQIYDPYGNIWNLLAVRFLPSL